MPDRIKQFKNIQSASLELFTESLSKYGNISNLITFRKKMNDSIQNNSLCTLIKNATVLKQDLFNLHNCAAQTYIRYTNIPNINAMQEKALDLFKSKNADYGDAFATNGIIGIVIRIGDKLSRLETLTTNKKQQIKTESIEDTIIDLYNYSTMALMLLIDHQAKSTDDQIKEKFAEKTLYWQLYQQSKHIHDGLEQEKRRNCKHNWVRDISQYCDGRTPHICTICGEYD